MGCKSQLLRRARSVFRILGCYPIAGFRESADELVSVASVVVVEQLEDCGFGTGGSTCSTARMERCDRSCRGLEN